MGRLQSVKQNFINFFTEKSVTKMEYYEEADFYELSEMLDDDSSRSSSPYFANSPPAANMVKIERVPSTHAIGKRRPGKAPSRPDWDLDAVELDRRERRRERNRIAAARCRNKRLEKVSDLEGQVHLLQQATRELTNQNAALQKELDRLRQRAKQQQQPKQQTDNCQHIKSEDFAVTFLRSPWALLTFPNYRKNRWKKIRGESLTEFTQFLTGY